MAFFPKSNVFYEKIEEAAQNVLISSRLLHEFMCGDGWTDAQLKQIEDKEHTGDDLTHQTVELLNKTFITPIDREDIHALICKLDDILDFIYGVANRMVLYKMGRPTEEFRQLSKILVRTVEEVVKAVMRLRELKNHGMVSAQCQEVGRLEGETDNLHRRAVAHLFDSEKDPIRLIKVKEILDRMERATDKCQDVADVIEGIAVKNA